MKFLSGKWVFGVEKRVNLLTFTAGRQTAGFHVLDSKWTTSRACVVAFKSATSGRRPPTSSLSMLNVPNIYWVTLSRDVTQECKLACGGKERFGTAASKFNEQRILFCTIVVVHLRYIFNDSMEFDGNNYFWISLWLSGSFCAQSRSGTEKSSTFKRRSCLRRKFCYKNTNCKLKKNVNFFYYVIYKLAKGILWFLSTLFWQICQLAGNSSTVLAVAQILAASQKYMRDQSVRG